MKRIQEIADKYGLKVIYDAAHAFGTEVDGVGIGNYGDISMFSFHATKLFNTIEGGCLTYRDTSLARRIFDLRNFGIRDEETVESVGINGKMDEVRAAWGLLNLERFSAEREKRRAIRKIYNERLENVAGIRVPTMPLGATDSCQYYPIVIEPEYGETRDELFKRFRANNIIVRKYFYPACTDYECYRRDITVKLAELPICEYIKHRVLCLPFYGALSDDDINRIVSVIVR